MRKTNRSPKAATANLFVFLIIFSTVMLNGCATVYSGRYNIELKGVERPENAEEQYGESELVTFEENGKSKYSYEDDLIKIIWYPGVSDFSFSLENKTNNSIKLIWDEAVYVDSNGSSVRVMHGGVKYSEASNSQPPSIIVKNATIEDVILPTNNVYFSEMYKRWKKKPLFPNTATTSYKLALMAKSYEGKSVRIVLPLRIGDTVNEYIFSFVVKEFIHSK